MSATKRSRGRQSEAGATPSLPPNKKAKTSGLAFLTDEKARAGRKLSANLSNGVKSTKANRVDESKAVVADHDTDAAAAAAEEVIELSSGADSDSDISGDEEEDNKPKQALTNGVVSKTAAAEDAEMADAEEEDAAGPSFGDLLQASHPETVDVQAAFADRAADTQAMVPVSGKNVLTAPSATSLGTVLTQALRTNDKELLESCFQMTDVASIRSTIQRLQSPLIANLLQRLAERLHKRPGRASNLMVWVQWSLVAHGGYLAGQPEVLKKLKSLQQVIKERASGLQSLMTLKGKLDMLGAQIELRRSAQETRAAAYDSDEEDPNVIYVEGEDDDESSDESDAEQVSSARKQKRNSKRGAESDDDDVDLSMVNGLPLEDDSDEEAEGAGEGMFDDEAEVTSDDEGEDSEDDDDEDDDEAEDDDGDDTSGSEDDAPVPAPVKAPKPQRPAGRRR